MPDLLLTAAAASAPATAALALDRWALHPVVLAAWVTAFWFGGVALIAHFAGWAAFAARHPAPLRLKAEQLRFCSVALGRAGWPMRYRRCVRVLLNAEGFGLVLMWPFRFRSPPFLAPWSAVARCTERQTLVTRHVTFHLQSCEPVITFSGPLGQLMKSRFEEAGGRVEVVQG